MLMMMMMMIWVLRLWWNRAGLVSQSEPFLFSFLDFKSVLKLEFEKAKRRSLLKFSKKKLLTQMLRSVCDRSCC